MNIKRMILVAVSMIATMSATAQSFEVKDFEEYVWGTYARTHPVKDYQNGELCAVIRFSVPTRGFKFTGDGVMKQTNGAGEVCVYVPRGTEKIHFLRFGIQGKHHDDETTGETTLCVCGSRI